MACAAAIFAVANAVRERRGTHKQTCGQKGKSKKIVNGENADMCEWNWQVGLWRGDWHFCGGMLISDEWVLTAAHCGRRADFDVVAGGYDKYNENKFQQRKKAVEWITHPDWNRRTMHQDLALVKLDSPVEFNDCIGSVCLPTRDVTPGESCWITGWGTLSSGGRTPDILQEVEVDIISNEDCTSKYDYEESAIDSSMICAQGKNSKGTTDACQGDSGGPLVCNGTDGSWAIYGATSWGYGCASPVYPGIWSRVHAELDWINSVTGQATGGKKSKGGKRNKGGKKNKGKRSKGGN